MTKKDFELIADAMRRAHNAEHYTLEPQWRHDCKMLATALATTNPKFDRARFLAACGVQS